MMLQAAPRCAAPFLHIAMWYRTYSQIIIKPAKSVASARCANLRQPLRFHINMADVLLMITGWRQWSGTPCLQNLFSEYSTFSKVRMNRLKKFVWLKNIPNSPIIVIVSLVALLNTCIHKKTHNSDFYLRI